jgi:amino acid adenylation domain-containing protein
MSHSPENKSDLIANRQALLDLLFQEEELGDASDQKIPRRQSTEPLQLSFAQQRLWFLDQWEPDSSTYNLSTAVRLTGPLNFAALERSLNEILRRHEALRTTFATVDGQPVQVVASPKAFALPMMSLQHLPETEREAEAQRLVSDERSKPFNLIKGPLFRPTLLQLGEAEYILLLTMHHIVSDGWSMGILFRELTVLYEAFSAGRPSPLPELSIQYADFAKWHREWLQGEVLERQLLYWKRQLEGIPAVINLPTDRPRPAVQGYRGKTQYLELTKELTEGLEALSRKEGVTLFMTLLAAFQALLYRYTEQEDVVVGSPIANRHQREIEGLIGFFVNTLVLRTDFSGNPSFRELLGRVRKTALDAYEHQDLPFEKLLEELQPERSLSYSPLFQVMFVLQNAPSTGLELEGLSVSPVRVGTETAKFDLNLSIHETPEGLSGALQYNTDLFHASTIERMRGHFKTLLTGIAANPEQRISELPLLTEAEKHQLIIEWNDTKTDYPRDKCIHELFETQVEKTPDAIALVFPSTGSGRGEDQQITYRALNNRANQFAYYLQKLGVGPEVLVGICVERSVEMIVGLLGILKVGGAYVPLDPSYPTERLAFMLEDTKAAVLVTQRQFVSQLPKLIEDGRPTTANNDQLGSAVMGPRCRMVCLDTEWEQVAKESSENPISVTTAENLAYVIYTSGSMGKPKGVMISHRAIGNHMLWMQEAFPLSESDRVLQKTPFSFDASIWEFYAPLLTGARLVVAPPRAHQDSACLVKVLAEQQVTVLQLVPSMLDVLVEEAGLESCQSLRRVFCGGEVLPSRLTERFFDRSNAQLYNLYGPTEATIDVTCGICGRNGGESVSIGRPIANMQVYILDSHLQPVPIGVVGELYIGGDGLARGYLNRSELTAEKFIPNPFSDEFNSRLYRTGDLARYLPDGNIEFLGRIDNQVKIRGFRIELGEVETVLSQHPVVRQSVVIVREDSPGDRRLVAYVVSSPDQVCTASELRSFLKEKLPEYMVPSAFVVLDAFPLTPNGKLDRKALPAPDQNRPALDETFTAPRTPVEELLTQIWSDVLKVDKVSIHDNFFDLGGHSLLATQLVSRVRDAFQMDIPLRTLFEKPTVEELAIAIMHHSRKQISENELSGILNDLESLSTDELKQRLV